MPYFPNSHVSHLQSVTILLAVLLISFPVIGPRAYAVALINPVGQDVGKSFFAANFSNIAESEIGADSTDSGVGQQRIDANRFQMQYGAITSNRARVTVDFTHETAAGDTPFLILPANLNTDASGRFVDPRAAVLSTDECNFNSPEQETRNQIQLSSRRSLLNTQTLETTLGAAAEDDYDAVSFGLEYGYDFSQGHGRLLTGGEIAVDRLEPTPFGFNGPTVTDNCAQVLQIEETRQRQLEVKRVGLYAGVDQVINRYTRLFMGAGVTHRSGDLSNPYLGVFIWDLVANEALVLAESRPDNRTQLTAEVSMRYFIPQANAALHADYKYYTDSWSLEGHTLQLRWYQNLLNQWQFVPALRYYSQSAADFYAPYYFASNIIGAVPQQIEVSSDYRLSPYGAVALSMELVKQIAGWRFNVLAEQYQGDEKFSLSSNVFPNPALLEYRRISVGMHVKW